MKIFAGFLLACVASPAWAQSAATIQIETASWGYAGQRKDVKSDVAKLCDGKATCTFAVKNETFTLSAPADPAPGSAKGLILVWKCADASKKDQFPENKPAVVACT
jgi:hypothetical protein